MTGIASATASGSTASADVQRTIADTRQRTAALLRTRIEHDMSADIIPPRADAAALAGTVVAVIQGMSMLARDGMLRPARVYAGLAVAESRRRRGGPPTRDQCDKLDAIITALNERDTTG